MLLRGKSSPGRTLLGWALAAALGVLCALLVRAGNPANMGICGACFLRDVAGSLGLIQGAGPKILRPEIVGVMLGALVFVVLRSGVSARSGGYGIARFFFGVVMAMAALVFLGCPFRMLQRIGGGDVNGWIGGAGFFGGVALGVVFERRGYSVGRTQVVAAPVGMLGPLVAVLLLVAFLVRGFLLGPGPGASGGPPHAAWALALGVALVAGAMLSATGFCTVAAARNALNRDYRMIGGAALVILAYAALSAAFGSWRFGMDGQPAAHAEVLWNVLAPALVGLTGVLAGGCPVRQIVMAGEGNGDAFLTVMGLLVGGGLAHNLGMVSSGTGTTPEGRWAVILGFAIALAYAAALILRPTGIRTDSHFRSENRS
jgi:uncharacterized protein